jgi:hypothetical protein
VKKSQIKIRVQLNDSSFGNDKEKGSDIQYGYVSYRRNTGNTLVNVGRVMVFEGIAAERVDGIYARTDLMKGFGISAFGGPCGSFVESLGGLPSPPRFSRGARILDNRSWTAASRTPERSAT